MSLRRISGTTYFRFIIGYFSARTEPSGWTHREYEDTILHAPEYNHKPLLQSQR